MIELPWDPEVESPATIAIIGGGPMGIEAGIYARFLGYFVSIIEERRVAHRMLDWHDRPLDVPVSECTTPLGHAAILAQYPEYVRRPADHVYSGRSYAEEYLLPLAKNDLLFDDIHFLSPVSDVTRLVTYVDDEIEDQERCNDEFRVLINGRHRGPWVSRADVVLDCRGSAQRWAGLGPGGGLAIGESELRDSFLKHTPLDRKFEFKQIAGKRICLIGQTIRAAQFALEFLEHHATRGDCRLHWIVRGDHRHDSRHVARALDAIERQSSPHVAVMESLGVEQIQFKENGPYQLRLLNGDDSTVDLECDTIAAFTAGRECPISTELKASLKDVSDDSLSFVTNEPGYYRIRGGDIQDGAGVGLKQGFEEIRKVFAMLAGREDLDLYRVKFDGG